MKTASFTRLFSEIIYQSQTWTPASGPSCNIKTSPSPPLLSASNIHTTNTSSNFSLTFTCRTHPSSHQLNFITRSSTRDITFMFRNNENIQLFFLSSVRYVEYVEQNEQLVECWYPPCQETYIINMNMDNYIHGRDFEKLIFEKHNPLVTLRVIHKFLTL